MNSESDAWQNIPPKTEQFPSASLVGGTLILFIIKMWKSAHSFMPCQYVLLLSKRDFFLFWFVCLLLFRDCFSGRDSSLIKKW
jgi:hypothetical protein